MSNQSLNSTDPHPSASHMVISTLTMRITLCLVIVILCLVGLVGNTIVAFLLSFRIKLNQSTIYILNLAVADFLFLFGSGVVFLYFLCLFNGVDIPVQSDKAISVLGELLNNFAFNASLLFLCTLSFERCLLVCFPIWYKCRRPAHLSAIMCSVTWVLSLLIALLERFLSFEVRPTVYIVTSVFFLILTLILIVSSVILLIQIQKASTQCRPLKLYIVVVASIINYLISLVPARLVRMIFFFVVVPTSSTKLTSYIAISLCSVFNSSVNPYIYIIVGKWNKVVSTTQALEQAFREDSAHTSEQSTSLGSQQMDSKSKPNVSELSTGDNL
ncbi:mas-related G-protein coupled receptor member D-like [Hyperolius riggenbachi]|uniref:mas-related G-protein coupled receptor member D-like n=1 Tax=Hyperolius riggenbachi TaxID=752182 RepID=UPI0035A2A25B